MYTSKTPKTLKTIPLNAEQARKRKVAGEIAAYLTGIMGAHSSQVGNYLVKDSTGVVEEISETAIWKYKPIDGLEITVNIQFDSSLVRNTKTQTSKWQTRVTLDLYTDFKSKTLGWLSDVAEVYEHDVKSVTVLKAKLSKGLKKAKGLLGEVIAEGAAARLVFSELSKLAA